MSSFETNKTAAAIFIAASMVATKRQAAAAAAAATKQAPEQGKSLIPNNTNTSILNDSPQPLPIAEESKIQELRKLGFPRNHAVTALSENYNSVPDAIKWLLSNMNRLPAPDNSPSSVSVSPSAPATSTSTSKTTTKAACQHPYGARKLCKGPNGIKSGKCKHCRQEVVTAPSAPATLTSGATPPGTSSTVTNSSSTTTSSSSKGNAHDDDSSPSLSSSGSMPHPRRVRSAGDLFTSKANASVDGLRRTRADWALLKEDDRKPYQEMNKQDHERYKKEMKVWKTLNPDYVSPKKKNVQAVSEKDI